MFHILESIIRRPLQIRNYEISRSVCPQQLMNTVTVTVEAEFYKKYIRLSRSDEMSNGRDILKI